MRIDVRDDRHRPCPQSAPSPRVSKERGDQRIRGHDNVGLKGLNRPAEAPSPEAREEPADRSGDGAHGDQSKQKGVGRGGIRNLQLVSVSDQAVQESAGYSQAVVHLDNGLWLQSRYVVSYGSRRCIVTAGNVG